MIEPTAPPRFDALDCVRATAMLLGVFFHALLFGGMVEGGPPGRFGPSSGFNGSMFTQDLLHSFRMPLFFLISGFFCRMMLKKYGIWSYFARRWWRIGIPLFVGIFTFVPLYQLVSASFRGGPPMSGSPMPGPPPTGAPLGGPPMGGFPFDIADLPPPPPGFVPPPLLSFDKNQDGSIDAQEWQAVQASMANGSPSDRTASSSSKIDDQAGPLSKGTAGDSSPDRNRSSIPGAAPAGGRAGRPMFPPGGPRSLGGPGGPGGMFGPPGAVSSWLFGSSARLFTLSHLWFLWYLLVYATVSPFIAMAIDGLVRRTAPMLIDQTVTAAIKWQVMPLLLGLVSVPLLLMTRSMFGWSLGFAAGIGRGFPDFLWHLEFDMPFYGIYFLFGWLLHRMRDELPGVASGWWINLAIGLFSFVGANYLSRTYSMQTSLPNYGILRLVGYGFYAVGGAYLAWGFLGTFQRFLDRPTTIGRYLADTALWVYLLHQALLFPFLAWLAPFKLHWSVSASLSTAMTIAAALLIFESIIRPTLLMALFGPTRPHRVEVFDTEDRGYPALVAREAMRLTSNT